MTALDLAAASGRGDMIKVLLEGESFLNYIPLPGNDYFIVNFSV